MCGFFFLGGGHVIDVQRCMSKWCHILQSVVVAVLGLAELVEKEDDGLKAKNEDNPADEAGSIERGFFLRSRGRTYRGGVCKEETEKERDKRK